MDDIIVRPRNPHYGIPNRLPRRVPGRLPYKKRNRSKGEDGNLAETILKQFLFSLIFLILIFAVKSVNTPVTNYLSEKAKLIASSNINLTAIYNSIDNVVKEITRGAGFTKNDSDTQNETDSNQTNIGDDQYVPVTTDGSEKETDISQQGAGNGAVNTGVNVQSQQPDVQPDDNSTTKKDDSGKTSDASQKPTAAGVQKPTSSTTLKTAAADTSKTVADTPKTAAGTSNSKIVAAIKSAYTFSVPVSGFLSSPYGDRIDPVEKVEKFHKGIDIAANKGVSIKAALSGTIIVAGTDSSYGNYVEIDHGDGLVTLYAHCSKLLTKKGQAVKKGDVIALIGDTGAAIGPHLHFEVRKDGNTLNPLDFIKVPVKV